MNILFISDAAENYSVGGFEPLGIMYLTSALKEAGHQVAICGAGRNEVKKYLSKFRPQVVAYSATTGAHRLFLNLNRRIKSEHLVFSVFGGPHPTFFPQMIEEEGVNALCIGEGEEVFVELAAKLERGEDISRLAIST